MASEARRGLVRIVANYARLGTNLSLGIILLPVILRWLGDDAVGVFLLLGSAVALPAIFRELINRGITRELGAALHDDDPNALAGTYNACLVVSASAAALTAIALTVMTLIIPFLRIPDALIWPAQIMVMAQGVYLCTFTLLAPAYNMLVVGERFVLYNIALVLERASYLIAALVLWKGIGIVDAPTGLAQFAILTAVIRTLVVLCAVALVVIGDRRLRPALATVTKPTLRAVASTFGWNSGVQIAMNLHERVALLIMNVAFGIVATAAFGVALRFVSYVRMATVGVTFGLDAVSARVSTKEAGAVKELMRHAARLQAFVAFPAGALMVLLCEPLLRVWIGHSLDNPEQVIPLAVFIARMLVVAITARALADTWIVVLYGAGYVHRYAPLVLAGGIANPIIALLLIWVLPERLSLIGPALAFAILMIALHIIALPVIGARCLGVSYGAFFAPFARPLVATLACVPVVIAGMWWLAPLGLIDLIAIVTTFGALYAIVGWFFVLDAQERKRFAGAITRRLPNARSRQTNP